MPTSACSPGRLGRRLAAPAALTALAAAAVLLPAGPSAAAGPGASGTFSITPAPGSAGSPAPYFVMSLAPGATATATVIITNHGPTAEKLKLSRSTGVTAGNGGSAFSQSFQSCAGPGCWVTGLPGNLTLAGGASEALRFTVHVPAGTQHGQYLAGITGELATKPASVQVGSNGQASARAIIVQQVTVAVAVTVGPLASLTTRLRISDVFGSAIGSLARLNIVLDNTGQTFTRATGDANCTAGGKQESYPVVASTVLPHDHATIPANARGLPEGASFPCRVRLVYGSGRVAIWTGQVSVPAPPRTRIIHTGSGTYAVIPAASGIPTWAIALIIVGVLLLIAVAVLLLRLHRQRRHLVSH